MVAVIYRRYFVKEFFGRTPRRRTTPIVRMFDSLCMAAAFLRTFGFVFRSGIAIHCGVQGVIGCFFTGTKVMVKVHSVG